MAEKANKLFDTLLRRGKRPKNGEFYFRPSGRPPPPPPRALRRRRKMEEKLEWGRKGEKERPLEEEVQWKESGEK